MRTRLFSILFLLLTAVMGTWAQHVTPEQAKEKASQFLKANYARTGGKRSAPAASALKTAVVFDAKDMAGQPYLYAVSATLQDGFVLVSGDERFKAVLGYSDVSNFDEQNMPDNMRVFLQGYIDEMKYLESINYQPTKAAPRRSMSNVGVLMTTTWNQGAPYNNQCPLDNSQRSATGCVATAMAQVVNYHIQNDHGPAATIAEIPGYTIPNTTITVSAIPSGTAIPSKDLLLNSYANKAGTDAEKTAVAQLMLYCGTSVQMKYSSGSSGTQTAYVANALINYFGFDNTTRFVRRIDYSYADWVNLIYNEVAASRPVVLGAGRAAGGHAFVADGFDATNTLFHINWGWGGYLDDYFALSVLNPDDAGQTGAAAGTDGYTIDQQAIVGIQHVGASGTTDPASLTMDSYRVAGTDIHFSAGNLTGTTNSFDIGVGVYDGSSITLFKLIASQSISTGSAFPDVSASAICADFANQTRKLIPMSRVSGTSTWIPGADPDINYFSAVYDAYGVPTLTAHPAPNFQNTTFSIPGTVFVNTPQYTNVTFTNNGEEYYGMAYFFVSTDANNKGAFVAQRGLGAPTGVPTSVEFEWTPTSATTYYIWATTDEAGTNVVGSTSVTATTDASLAGKTLAIVNYQLEGQDDQSFQIDGNGTRSIDVYGSMLKGKVTIKNLSASAYNYNGKYITLTYKKWNGSQFVMLNSDYDIGVLQPSLAGGAEVTFDVNRDGLSAGLYQISLTTFEIDANHYVQNRTELDERYTINLKPIGMTIASASDWATFCTNVNGGTTYSGQLVKLTADITTSTGMDNNHAFSGVFDGGGHTLNITISGSSWNMAPFPVISGATIKNLTVTGSVTNTSNFTGGLVGQAMGNNNLIENCVVNTDVTGDTRIGGVVGQLTGSLTIKDVVYGGTITNTYNEAIGGIIGCYNNTDKSLTMTNCLFKGTNSSIHSPFHPIGMKYNTSSTFSTLSCTNCFYTANPQNNPAAGAIIADGTKVSQLSLGQGVSILSGNTCSFLNEVFHYGTVTLGYNDPEAVVTYSLDGTPLPGNSFTISKDDAAFNDGTATITADYSFTISYNLDGGTVATPNPTTYTSASSDITLNNPTREGWTFTGWTGTGLNGAQMTVTIAQGSTGHRHYTATWTADELDIDASGAYVINNKNDWERFCARVNSGNNYWSKTVKLTADIGTAQNPVTIKAGGWVEGYFKNFQASFDGQGHTLTVNYFDGAPFQGTINATIRNLHVAGNITASSHFAAGFVSEAHYGLTIENCRSSVAISSSVSGDGTHGGLVGVAYHDDNSNVNITGCLFDGSITTTNNTNNCGGFIGWSYNSSLTTLSNSVLKPSSVSNGMLEKTFVRYNSDTAPTITNTYYVHVDNLTENQGKEAHTITAGENVSSLAISTTPTAEYNVSGIKVYGANNGIMIGTDVYAANGEEVNLALTANPPTNYIVDTYTASAGTITAQTETSATLTMPNENVTIGAVFLFNASYIAADGTLQSHTATELTSSDHELTSGWYVVNGNVAIAPYVVPLWDDWAGSYNYVASSRINISGDVNIILADGATLNAVNGTYTGPEYQEGRDAAGGIHVPAGSSLTIYRQSGGTGVLNAETNSSDDAAIGGGYPGLGWGNAHAGTITIYGGIINATAYVTGIGGAGGNAGGSHGGTVNIHGGLVTAQGGMGAAIGGGGSCTGFTVNIFGGTVNATGGTGAAAIGGGGWGSGGTVTISGGVINATANYSTYLKDYEGYGIGGGTDCNSPTTVNLSWTNTTDRITATSYNGTVNLKKAFQDTDGATWSAADNISTKPDGKTLYPENTLLFLANNVDNTNNIDNNDEQTRNVVLSDRTLYKDGKWNTLCLPFNLTAAQIAAHADFAGATLMELNTDGTNGFDATDGTLYLAFKEATAITAGVPYLVKWDAAGDDFTSPVFSGVTIDAKASTTVSDADTGLQEVQMVGCYSPVSVVADDKSILFLGDENTLYYSSVNRNIRSCRAYFSVPYLKQNPGAKARAFRLDFGDEEATGILEVSADSIEMTDDAWYSLDGVRLSGKPAQRGIYINNGNKVVIK